MVFFYYSNTPNYTVDVTDVAEQKAKASAAHISQFGDMVTKYDDSNLEQRKEEMTQKLLESPILRTPEGRYEEKFRRSEGYGG